MASVDRPVAFIDWCT